ncbi:unnamed protein product [Rotaria sp. Silwood2]|nr:unnamed protein product [Rotaria sp. Silwood2]CAF3058280.1 unnamed protein product [Rotaria sp. Silwood2]CAF3187146.1 unnamed protein product [Rotaria sp. Silwood2]CAF4279212.1 unnamed protein product [Rotaria sp. Silwood2]CAF4282443.1 unnamed protein product [Rotaria sp. Silwood2]
MYLTLIILVALIPSITTLQCYVCNSNDNPECTDVSNLASFAKTCNETIDPYCRTISQTINEVKSIVRACGSKASLKSCYKTAGFNNANVCSCNVDLCNKAPNFNRQQQIMTILSSIIIVATTMVMLR